MLRGNGNCLQRLTQTDEDGVEASDPFAAFARLALELEVQDLVEKKETDPTARVAESESERQQVETYGVLEGVLKYATEHVLLVGKPGAGKTTALERLLAEGNLIEGRLPVFLRLRDLNPKREYPVLERLQLELLNRDLQLSPERLEELLDGGQFLLLLDGINELPDPRLRREVWDFRERYRLSTP